MTAHVACFVLSQEAKDGDHGSGDYVKEYGTPPLSKHKTQLQSYLWFAISFVGKLARGIVHWAAGLFSLGRFLGRTEL